ncbi:helix-turn-helix domain-containing protein [Klebsiella pneumoniae]|uniref:Insertion element IS150 protein InsJ-like helix-turn-helix domain-containing protein n=2 Tax=Klebsiella pneumoniae TaxID=573 RepID=A0A919LU77_KLEPN|nr:helix-turn-helix domain-containing protein [Klebsiella pneumoniae]GHK54644.1 hypothetical protein KPZU09_43800 [Klebsiella pneumoniae]CDL11025.1 Mobile element protein [Klebsiella pneumoniae IS43]
MAKPKYSPETKLAVVNHYLSGKDGEQSTADLFGIERTSVRRWVRAWQFHGAEGLTAKIIIIPMNLNSWSSGRLSVTA